MHSLPRPQPEPVPYLGQKVPACPVSRAVSTLPSPPKPPSSFLWQCSSLRNQTQYKPLLGGILFSPFNRLEVFYIRRKTTFELVVLFSELCFVFALIKFPLTQISIKCGSHQRQTLATLPALLGEENLPLLWKCFSGVSDSGKQAPAKTHPFRPCVSARLPFETL